VTLYIDPGTTESHGVLMEHGILKDAKSFTNLECLEFVQNPILARHETAVVIEGITPQLKIGQTTLDTVFWSGRFAQAAPDFRIINRQDVKRFWKEKSQYDGNMNDKKIKDAIRELYPDVERDKMLKGKSHCWQAFAMGLMDWLVRGEQ